MQIQGRDTEKATFERQRGQLREQHDVHFELNVEMRSFLFPWISKQKMALHLSNPRKMFLFLQRVIYEAPLHLYPAHQFFFSLQLKLF